MIEINPSRWRRKPWKHQMEGIKGLVRNPLFNLFFEMRLGKSACAVIAAQLLMEAGFIRSCVIACPAQVVDVWADPEIGEIAANNFMPRGDDFADCIYTFKYNSRNEPMMEDLFFNYKHAFVVTSFEFLRQEDAFSGFPKASALARALPKGQNMLVIDEGTCIGNWKALQTTALESIRPAFSRVHVLDGTPVGNSPMELYSKFHILDPEILGYKSFFHFRGAHAVTVKKFFGKVNPKTGKKRAVRAVQGFQRLERITQRSQNFCLRATQAECLDMPEKVYSFITVPLGRKSWDAYEEMREDMIVELDDQTVSVGNAAVKVLRLNQITSGFLGGVAHELSGEMETVELSREKRDACLSWLETRLVERPDFKCVFWCRYTAEINSLVADLKKNWKELLAVSQVSGGTSVGGELLHPSSKHEGPVALVAQPMAGRYGKNYSRADTEVYVSQDYNLVTRQQSEDRLQAENGRKTTLVIDMMAVGPQGEKTIDWDIMRALRERRGVADRTQAEWRRVLKGE